MVAVTEKLALGFGLLFAAFVLSRTWESMDDPCDRVDAMKAMGPNREALSAFQGKCPDFMSTDTCEPFKALNNQCGECLIESLTLANLGDCFTEYSKDGTDGECMRSVTYNFYRDCFSPSSIVGLAVYQFFNQI